MGMMDKFRNFMGVPDEDEDYYDETEENTLPPKKTVVERENTRPLEFGDNDYPTKSPNKVVNIAATTQLAVILVKPECFNDASSIADHLNAKRTVVLNLESTDREIARRLVDFLSGVAYANEGQIKRVANSTFIITPYNVDFVGDLLDELENSGMSF